MHFSGLPKLRHCFGWHDACECVRNEILFMKFTIEVGEIEKHRIEYSFNPLLGVLVVKVDGQPVRKHVRLINEPVRETHALVVGERERHNVRIEKERTSTFSHRSSVFVNNRLLKVVERN